MTAININGVTVSYDNIPDISSVSFNYLGNKVYSAQKIERIFGVFVSQPIQGESGLVSWQEVSWVSSKPVNTDVFVYIKSASTLTGLDSATWNGPYLNSTNSISDIKGIYLQFMIILSNYNATTPVFSSISLTYLSNSNAALFYTRAFDLGFVPKHILLTYNGDIDEDSIIRFYVAGFDSIDPNDYQLIDPNKIEELSDLSLLSNKIKLMIEMIGNTTTPIVIHEVALMFSGDGQLMVNDFSSSSSSISSSSSYIENWSTSSESSSSSSYIENWSSSSLSTSSSSYIENWSSSSSSYIENLSSSSSSNSSSMSSSSS